MLDRYLYSMSTIIDATPATLGTRSGHSAVECTQSLQAVQDALYVLSGKWKLPIIIALKGNPKRFGELQRLVSGITAKVLSKELKELEMNEFAVRRVYATIPVTVEYELTEYSQSLDSIIEALRSWGIQHRSRILGQNRGEE